ncbi:hypothetical protein BC940DRAFT_301083 [Gongronella butleri]|nr:hypothetical protein BC940DRAFT_301083 [Gongronella butleri]
MLHKFTILSLARQAAIRPGLHGKTRARGSFYPCPTTPVRNICTIATPNQTFQARAKASGTRSKGNRTTRAPKNATDAQDTTTARDDDDAALEHRVVENDEDWEALIAEYNFPGEPSQLENEIEDAQSDAEIADDFDEGELFDWALIIDELRTIGDARYSMTFYMTMPLVNGRSENRPEPDDLDVFTIPGSYSIEGWRAAVTRNAEFDSLSDEPSFTSVRPKVMQKFHFLKFGFDCPYSTYLENSLIDPRFLLQICLKRRRQCTKRYDSQISNV